MGGRLLLLAVAVILAPRPACGQEIGDDPLDPQVNAALGAAMDLGADPRPAAMDVWRACVVHYGKIDPLIGELDRRVGEAPDARTKLALIRFSARTQRCGMGASSISAAVGARWRTTLISPSIERPTPS